MLTIIWFENGKIIFDNHPHIIYKHYNQRK